MHRSVSNALKRWSRAGSLGSLGSPIQSEHLCKTCQELVITQNLLKGITQSQLPNGNVALDVSQRFIDLPMRRKDQSPEFPLLRNAATSGCDFCACLYDAIQRDKTASPQTWTHMLGSQTVIIRFRYCYGPDLGLGSVDTGRWPIMLAGLEAVIHIKESAGDLPPVIIVFKVHCESGSVVGDYLRIRRRPIEQLALSPNNLRTMRNWINDCRDNHFACCPLANTSTPARPTRLVYVGDRQLGYLPRLALSSHLPGDVRYAALSYCWGPPGSMRLTTTIETLNFRLHGIPWDELPKTFSDAFLTARMLGFEYVWIDALCIVQNDNEDWQAEAVKMGDIYRGAQLAIVAASAKSTNDGFLDRTPDYYPIAIPYQSTLHDQVVGQYYLNYSEQGYNEEFGVDVDESIWNQRGWTFQERQLSRRVLIFGKKRLYFECRMHRRAEGHEDALHRTLAFYKHMQSTDDWDVLHMSWRKIVEEFSGRNFTFSKDRLPALSGLAREIISKSNNEAGERREYLAGHWTNSLEIDLTWIPDPGQTVAIPQSDSPDAPSWSWSSMPRRVVWPRHDAGALLQARCTVERGSTKLNSLDPLGDVAAGFIDIIGPITKWDDPSKWFYTGRWNSEPIGHIEKENVSRPDRPGPPWYGVQWHQVDEGTMLLDRWKGIYDLQVAYDNRSQIGGSVWLAWTSDITNTGENFHCGILLKQTFRDVINDLMDYSRRRGIDCMRFTFRRVGVFRAKIRERDIVLQTRNGVFKFSPGEAFETVLGFERRLFRVT